MKMKNLFVALGGLALIGGASIGLANSHKEMKVAKADVTCTFRVASSELSSWGNVDNWGIYAWHDETPIIDAFDDCYGNMTLSDGYYSKSVSYTDTIDGVILLFKQGDQKWRSSDVTFGGGFTNTHVYTLSYNAWTSDNDGYGRKTFTANIEDSSVTPVFSLIGDYGGHNWDNDDDFNVDEATTTATLSSVTLAKGNTFKVRKNHDWAVAYGWSHANGHISVSDDLDRGEACLGDAGSQNNIEVLHNGTYSFSLNYSTGVLTITGSRAASDSAIAFEIWISTGGAAYAPAEMGLKAGSESEYMITRDFVAGERFYFKFGSTYYHYEDVKENTLKGTQFVAEGEVVKVLYNANYTIYFETVDGAETDIGCWLHYNSVSAAQIEANLISYATYFNDEVGGACKDDGSTTISELQTAWTNVKTRYDNAPADSVRTAIAGATASHENAEVKEFVGKYQRVYELRGSSLSSQGGDFLSKGYTPGAQQTFLLNDKNNTALLIVLVSALAVSAVAAFYFIRKRKADR